MKKYAFVAIMLSAILLISIIFTTAYVKMEEDSTSSEDTITVVTSFYPMYIAAMNVVGDTEGVTLQNLSEPQTGCLHDFQMTPEDMKLLSTADVFIINGGGIESFMADVAEAYPDLTIIEACSNIELLAEDGDDGDEDDGDEDDGDEDDGDDAGDSSQESTDVNAHAWMSISCYRSMVTAIASGLAAADPDHAGQYTANAAAYDDKLASLETEQATIKASLEGKKVILFHEAYYYVAMDYGLEAVFDMDLDEERQVSAGEVAQVISAIDTDGADLILAEELYGADMAETVQAERSVTVLYLDPLTRGDYDADSYLTGMQQNIDQLETLTGK